MIRTYSALFSNERDGYEAISYECGAHIPHIYPIFPYNDKHVLSHRVFRGSNMHALSNFNHVVHMSRLVPYYPLKMTHMLCFAGGVDQI